MKSECIRIYIVWKVNVAINPFRAAVFLEEGTPCLEIEERMYSNIYCPESQHGNQPLQSCIFLREKNAYVARKLKKIAYILLLGEMKTECIRIYCPERQRGDQSLQSCVFLIAKNAYVAGKLKKIAVRFALRGNEDRMY